MKPLETRFRLKGWDYEQVARSTEHGMFRKRKNDWADDKWSYEVVKIQKQKAGVSVIGGVEVKFEAKEALPGDSTWGMAGWTYPDRKAARAKFDALVSAEEDLLV